MINIIYHLFKLCVLRVWEASLMVLNIHNLTVCAFFNMPYSFMCFMVGCSIKQLSLLSVVVMSSRAYTTSYTLNSYFKPG